MKTPLTFIGAIFLLSFATWGQTNEWTKPSSGAWEESYWSLGQLPGLNQDVAIDNYGWKAVAIGPATTANYPQSLSMNTLLIDGPTNSLNTLLLNWAQLSVPLTLQSNLTIGTNGALVSHYSALRAANASIAGAASFMDYATENFGQLLLRSGGTVGLTNGIMTTSNLLFFTGTFSQSGGIHNVNVMNTQIDGYDEYIRYGEYDLNGGTLISTNISLGNGGGYSPAAHGIIHQTGGVHTNVSIGLSSWSHHWATDFLGHYQLEGGLLVSGSVDVGGGFSQTGGTNRIQELFVYGGDFVLSGGELVTSNESVHVYSEVGTFGFYQTGGVHTVQGELFVTGSPDMHLLEPAYEVAGGSLVTSNITVQVGAFTVSSQGTVSNAGIITLTAGNLFDSGTTATQFLGQLQLATNGDLYTTFSGGTIDLGYNPARTNQTVWRFGDSHALPWIGVLQITNWGPATHLFFGTNAQGLTQAQLDQVRFTRFGGYSTVNFPARLLPTGELVPAEATNDWTKASAGAWEEGYWSLGVLPGPDQTVAFRNPGSKSLGINLYTVTFYPQSLSMDNFILGSPGGQNVLYFAYPGTDVPFSVSNNFIVGSNGYVNAHYAALQAARTDIAGEITLSDTSVARFEQLWLHTGNYGLSIWDASSLTSSNQFIDNGRVGQVAGTNVVENLYLPESLTNAHLSGHYIMDGGTLLSQRVTIGLGKNQVPSGQAYGLGELAQLGGIHTNGTMSMRSIFTRDFDYEGLYTLRQGWLVSDSVDIDDAIFRQEGGTNLIQELNITATLSYRFNLDGGLLVTSNTTVIGGQDGGGVIYQDGGTHIVRGTLSIHDGYAGYRIVGGNLLTTNILLDRGQLLMSEQGSVSNSGVLTLSAPGNYSEGITLYHAAKPQYLGQLRVGAGGGIIAMHYYYQYSPATNGAVLRFADSHTQPWLASIQIYDWGVHPGDHIYFGTNAQGLTASQLSLITFVLPGATVGSYYQACPARLLSTGEIVPVLLPPISWTNSGGALVLSWPGGYQLTSSTNINGPFYPITGVTGGYTNNFTDPQRFFRLQLPAP